jgi:glucose-1-phosphate cytidylyltransferase
MKVVLFCGGMGMRMREYSEAVPKPMVPIGYRPILWHVMKYYAHYGHKDFILCLGYKADVIKRYFLEYNEWLTNDFVISGGKNVQLLNQDIHDWRISFVDTGLRSNIGQRLKAVEKLIEDDDVFLANYTDGLADVSMNDVTAKLQESGKIALFVSVMPKASFHFVDADSDGIVGSIEHIRKSGARINGGFFAFRREIFQYIRDGEELVEEPFRRLIAEKQLISFRHDGFWACMDTYKELQELEDMFAREKAPWTVWNGAASKPAAGVGTETLGSKSRS